jgi:hypothetical protein
MARLDIDAEQSFAFLKRVSMTTNRKPVNTAAEITRRTCRRSSTESP